jgi:hypothetical protein
MRRRISAVPSPIPEGDPRSFLVRALPPSPCRHPTWPLRVLTVNSGPAHGVTAGGGEAWVVREVPDLSAPGQRSRRAPRPIRRPWLVLCRAPTCAGLCPSRTSAAGCTRGRCPAPGARPPSCTGHGRGSTTSRQTGRAPGRLCRRPRCAGNSATGPCNYTGTDAGPSPSICLPPPLGGSITPLGQDPVKVRLRFGADRPLPR